jgi:hypothetical protein
MASLIPSPPMGKGDGTVKPDASGRMCGEVETPPLGRLAATAIALEILLGIGAIGGGIALMAGPNGEVLPLPVSALTGSPFADYFAPGAILFAILGLGPLGAALLAWRRHPLAPFLAFAVGSALLIWLAVEIAIVGYANDPPLQPLYLGLGIVIVLVGVVWWRRTGFDSSRARRKVAHLS